MSQIKPPMSIRELLSMNLAIPNYQRPYKWKEKNVLSLITDVDRERTNAINRTDDYRYRIGSVILHEENGVYNVVDGQQRMLTACLILSEIMPADKTDGFSLLGQQFTNPVSLNNLSYNLERIGTYFQTWPEDNKRKFAEYLLDGCEVIIIEAENIAEAFQLFDSQNARGKTLEPADLLKAYHLRSMDDEHEKRMCVQRWEEAIDKKILHYVLSDIIYRCRCWMRRDYDKYYFSNDTLDEFKGADIDIFSGKESLPYARRLYLQSQMALFAIDEPIVNGRRFFDYVDHYIAMYEKLFPARYDRQPKKGSEKLERDNHIQDMVRTYCFYSPRMHRIGDTRLRNALYCMSMVYFDKFGLKEFDEFFKVMYSYVYQHRIEMPLLRMESIRDHILRGTPPRGVMANRNLKNPFEWLADSYLPYPSELRSLLRLSLNMTPEEMNAKIKE